MNAQEFVTTYNMHDSLIDAINISEDKTTITILINFAFWMQSWYKKGDSETGLLEVRFRDIAEYNCPKNLPLDEISILRVSEKDGRIHFAILNDMTDAYYDLFINSNEIDVQVLS